MVDHMMLKAQLRMVIGGVARHKRVFELLKMYHSIFGLLTHLELSARLKFRLPNKRFPILRHLSEAPFNSAKNASEAFAARRLYCYTKYICFPANDHDDICM